ncbi:hypothetical protein INT47_009095 [Mucor saturninus]|uniref:Ndc10 domain-containing protein n=1 Tax=Mucor saturninus TaxID=64648 RepID=A0A8H7RPE5_9FUNG|nr:hypothetical protein INT47_009095 [Mucor saturninus]
MDHVNLKSTCKNLQTYVGVDVLRNNEDLFNGCFALKIQPTLPLEPAALPAREMDLLSTNDLKKAYASKTNEFIKWANETFTDENELERSIVSGTKLNYFLRDQVLGRNSRQKSNVPTAPKKIKTSTLEQYIAAITDLYKTQVQKKINCNEHPRATVLGLIKSSKMKEFEVSRENCEDRGEGTLADGYTSLDQVSKIVQFYLNGQRNHGENLRDALAFLFSHYFFVRPDIKCPALVMVLRQGKTNKNNRLELKGSIRSTPAEICPIMIFGLYLFWRFHVQNEPFPDFTTSENCHRDAVARQFYLPRASVDPPESLCKMIFPDLHLWHDRLTAKQVDPNNNNEMEVTVAAKAFFELLFMLRKTIIQDAVFMMEKFPNHPLWQNSLFSHDLFTDYRERMLIEAQEDNDPMNALLRRCVPILEDKIKYRHHDLSTRLDTQSASQEKIIDYITRLVTGQASISLNISLLGVSGENQGRTAISTTSIPQEDDSLSSSSMMKQPHILNGNTSSQYIKLDAHSGITLQIAGPEHICSLLKSNNTEFFVQQVWNSELDGLTNKAAALMEVIQYTLTSFHLALKSSSLLVQNHERTPFIENIVPSLLALSKIVGFVEYKWCETQFTSSKHLDLDTMKYNDVLGYFKTFNNMEIIIVESSSGKLQENTGHTIEDCLKLLECGISSLRKEAILNKNSSIATFKKLKVFGLQTIKNQVTLSELYMNNDTSWNFIEKRTATLSSSWDDRILVIQYLELIATMFVRLNPNPP